MKAVLKCVVEDNVLMLILPEEPYRSAIKQVVKKCNAKTNGYVSITIERPYRPRTTGENSQNNLFWKICTLIANKVGDDSEGMKDTEKGIKMRALSKGYPFHLNKITGEKEPESMTKINTVECSYLIDTAIQIASELGIALPPELIKDEK